MATRLEGWFWSATDGDGCACLRGEVYDDPPPRSYPDGDHVTTREVEEEERRGAAEGTTVSTASGRRYLLGVPATHDTLADQRDAAQRKVSELQEKLAAIERAANPKKRPRGRAPEGFSWDKQKCGWFDENGEQFEKVDHPTRKKAAEEYAERDRTRARSYGVSVSSGPHRAGGATIRSNTPPRGWKRSKNGEPGSARSARRSG